MKTDREYVLDRKRENTKLDANNREQYQRSELPKTSVNNALEDSKTVFENED